MTINNPRVLATTILTRVEQQKSYANLSLDKTIQRFHLNGRDAAFLTTLVYGVIQNRITIDYLLSPFLKRPDRLPIWTMSLLRISVFQMHYLDRIPKHAILNEAIEIAKKRGNMRIAKLVTAVLHQVQRHSITAFDNIKDPYKRLSVMYSMPVWLVKKLSSQYGVPRTEHILMTLNQPARASLRVNTKLISRDELLAKLQPEFPQLRDSEVSPFGLVSPGGHFAGTPAFKAGYYTMQDESSMLVAPSLQIAPNHHVLDACAAPGGKTTHIAQYLDAKQGGKVTALDLHPHKIKLIKENAQRMHLSDVITARAMDARNVKNNFADQSFDRILVDAPCSGLGLMRRKPEIRYDRQPEDLQSLPKIQLAILNSVADKVKVNGLITYSTCTIVAEENQDVVNVFLKAHDNFKLIPVKLAQPLDIKNQPYLQLLPDDYGTDGFFIASMQRIK